MIGIFRPSLVLRVTLTVGSLVLWMSDGCSAAFLSSSHRISFSQDRRQSLHSTSTSSWTELEAQLEPAWSTTPTPVTIDSVWEPNKPVFSSERPTLFRERHGWCPYSERVWLTLEMGNIEYDTILIDNTDHGPKPSYFFGQTPQIKWPRETRPQGESMDLVRELDRRYSCNLQSEDPHVLEIVSKFRDIFPRARPSSRAAFLFQYNGDPLWKSTFETTLEKTNELLGQTAGPFFCGNDFTAADIAWAPFLERYRYQLPCLHQGLAPDDSAVYPHLAAWYNTMDSQVPCYACRVKGDASSWRKVLTMAGYGNSGVPPEIGQTIKSRIAVEEAEACCRATDNNQRQQQLGIWKEYAATRPFVASTSPAAQAALIITRNRHAIVQDLVSKKKQVDAADGLSTAEQADEALQILVHLLLGNYSVGDLQQRDWTLKSTVAALTAFLDQRMCVPRDMGAMSAACIKHLAVELRDV